jgi:hypothetical protein
LWRTFAHFELGAHSLDLRGLFFELCDHGLHFTLQLSDARLLLVDLLLLFRDFAAGRLNAPS